MSAELKACRLCGKVFFPKGRGYHAYCSQECSRFACNRRYSERARRVYRAKKDAELMEQKKAENAEHKVPDLNATLKELHQYNKEHGTCISYGQWAAGRRADNGCAETQKESRN